MGELEPVNTAQPQPEAGLSDDVNQIAWWQKGWDMIPDGGKKALALAGTIGGLAAGYGLANKVPDSEPAFASDTPGATILSTESSSFFSYGGSKHQESDLASGKVTFLSNVRAKGMPQSWVNRQKAAGNCEMVGAGTSNPVVYTQGHNVSGMSLYGRDTRRSLVCNGIRVACGNKVRFVRPKNTVPGVVIWVRSFANAKLKLHAEASAKAAAECHTPDNTASASAYGEGSAYANEEVRLKLFAKTKGAALVKLSGQMTASAEAKASAKAEAQCKETSTSTSTTTTSKTTQTIPPKTTTTITTTTTEKTTPPPPPPPPKYTCSLQPITQKSGFAVNLTISDNGKPEMDAIDWGDGSPLQLNPNDSQTQTTLVHNYSETGSFTITDHQSYDDNGTADCAGNVSTGVDSPPPPPPPYGAVKKMPSA